MDWVSLYTTLRLRFTGLPCDVPHRRMRRSSANRTCRTRSRPSSTNASTACYPRPGGEGRRAHTLAHILNSRHFLHVNIQTPLALASVGIYLRGTSLPARDAAGPVRPTLPVPSCVTVAPHSHSAATIGTATRAEGRGATKRRSRPLRTYVTRRFSS